MLADVLLLVYILMLFPLVYECEKLRRSGFRVLLVGALFTPVAGYIYLYFVKRKISEKSSEQRS